MKQLILTNLIHLQLENSPQNGQKYVPSMGSATNMSAWNQIVRLALGLLALNAMLKVLILSMSLLNRKYSDRPSQKKQKKP